MIRKNFWFFLILIFSLFLRLIKLDILPLFGDEIDVGYQAFSLLTTGKDYMGNFLPSYLQSFSESRAPLLIYTSIPFVSIFGLNEYGIRLAPAVFGLISLIYFYLLIKLLTRNPTLSLLCTFFLSITPWHLHYSRCAFEVTLLLALILAAIFYFYTFLDTKKHLFLSLSFFLFALTFYTYNTANIFTPLIMFTLFSLTFPALKKLLNSKITISNFLFLLIFILPIISKIFLGQAANRFNLISIFNDKEIISEIINKRTDFTSSQNQTERIFHNKPTAYISNFYKNYLTSFSFQFLFLTGDSNPRHNIPQNGLILTPLAIILVIGLINVKIEKLEDKLMIIWLTIAPIAASLTINGGSHPTRLFVILPPLIFFISLGFLKLNKYIKAPILILIFTSFGIFIHEYFIHYPKQYFEQWQFGYKDLFQTNLSSGNQIFVSNTNYTGLPHFLFYQKYSPQKLISSNISDREIKNILPGLSGFKLNDQTYFINNWQESESTLAKIQQTAQAKNIFVLFQLKDIPGDWNLSLSPLTGFKTLKTVFNPNGSIFGQIIQKI